ncbi:MipA/OmpV family protein [Taklimakanibacter lacteus]|uniref:MipA/OmpV family protein n=1 Tax=Taklimakanibacter lacteus TaxID=2268456 RepID=UPI0034D3E951
MPYHYRLTHCLALAAGLLALIAPLETAEAGDPIQDGPDGGSWLEIAAHQAAEWNVMLGAGIRVEPKFEGAKDFTAVPIPMISAQIGEYVSVSPMGVTVNAWQYEGLSVKGHLGQDFGRDSDDDKHLDGLGDIDASAVVGVELTYELMPLEFNLSVDQNIGGGDGLLAKFGTAVKMPLDSFMFSIGSSVTWADDNYMETYFGVTGKQSVKSGLREFDAEAGFKRVDLEISGMYFINDHWVARGDAGVGYLVGDAADSPVSQENLQPYAMFILGYKF